MLDRVAYSLRVANVDRVTLKAFHRLRYVHAANRRTNNILHIVDVQAKARGTFTIDVDIHVAPTRDTLGIHRGGAIDIGEHALEILADTLNHLQIRPGHLDADRRLYAGREHIDARFDGHHPGIGKTRVFDDSIELGAQTLRRHARAPLLARL